MCHVIDGAAVYGVHVYFQNFMATRHLTIAQHHPTYRQHQLSTNPSRDVMALAGCVNYRSRRVSRLRQQHAPTAVHVTSNPCDSRILLRAAMTSDSVRQSIVPSRDDVSTKTTRSAVNITVLVCSLYVVWYLVRIVLFVDFHGTCSYNTIVNVSIRHFVAMMHVCWCTFT